MSMFHERKNFKTIIRKTEKNPQPDIAYAGFHGSVEHGDPILIISFFCSRRVIIFIQHGIVCFLKTDIGSDFFIFQFFKILNRHRCQLDIDSADIIFPFPYRICGANRFAHIINVVFRGLATDQQYPFVPLSKQHFDLPGYFGHCQYFAHYAPVLSPERTVHTVIDTDISGIKRGEKNETFSVNIFFHHFRSFHYPAYKYRVVHHQKRRDIGLVQSPEQQRPV